MRNTMDRLRFALGMVAAVTFFGTVGYWLFGLSLLDAVYQTVTTITTVGFSELKEFGNGEKIFTIILILIIILIIVGVSTVLYSFTLVVQVVVIDQSFDRVNDLEFPVVIGDDGDLLRLENLARSTS